MVRISRYLLKQKGDAGKMKIRFSPYGIHCFDRKTGWNILMDEVQVQKNKWHKAPETISIAITNKCDLSCSFCYAPKIEKTLNKKDIIEWVLELSENGCLCVGFGGGEPTVYQDFVELCQTIHNSTNMAVTFTTHGHNLTSDYCRSLRCFVDLVRVSVDGVGKTYETLRNRSFEDILKRLKIIKTYFNWGISTLVNMATLGDLDKILTLCKKEGASDLLLLPEIQNGQIMLSKAGLRSLENWILLNHERFPIKISEMAGASLNLPYLKQASINNTFDYMHIDAGGTLKETSFMEDGEKINSYSSIIEAIDNYRVKYN